VKVPKPGTSGSGQQVEIEYLYTALGNVLEVRTPSPNPRPSVRTTRYFYGVDPFTNDAEPERLNCPLAVAVYDGGFNPGNVTDRLIYRASFRYDAWGRLVQMVMDCTIRYHTIRLPVLSPPVARLRVWPRRARGH